MHHVRKGVSGRAGLCATRTTPSSPREQQGIVFICIYIGVSLRTLPCTLTRRRFPIFRPKLSTEKPRPSNPPPPPLSTARAIPCPRVAVSSPFPAAVTPLTRGDSRMQRRAVIFG